MGDFADDWLELEVPQAARTKLAVAMAIDDPNTILIVFRPNSPTSHSLSMSPPEFLGC